MNAGPYTTLIDARSLEPRIGSPDWAIVDCRFDLMDTAAGRRDYLAGHLPGAIYADLDRDLSGPPETDRGRHPLPSPERLAATFSAFGIDDTVQVVAYDRADGAIAARLWWMLRYMGHQAVAVLDGGFDYWCATGGATEAGAREREPREFRGAPIREWLVRDFEVAERPHLIDARAPARFRGEVEPLDPVAGHIPGAVNRCYRRNVDDNGRFRDPARLREEWLAAIGEVPPEEVTHYCGSGVTACHNLLATACAGLPPGRLYAGSWSDWCADPSRPIATGP